jgi:transcriptional adapter 2-alpha
MDYGWKLYEKKKKNMMLDEKMGKVAKGERKKTKEKEKDKDKEKIKKKEKEKEKEKENKRIEKKVFLCVLKILC